MVLLKAKFIQCGCNKQCLVSLEASKDNTAHFGKDSINAQRTSSVNKAKNWSFYPKFWRRMLRQIVHAWIRLLRVYSVGHSTSAF